MHKIIKTNVLFKFIISNICWTNFILNIIKIEIKVIFKPYKITIIIDSLILIYSFTKAWKRLFKLVNPYKNTRQIVVLLFSVIALIYFSLYGILGSFNLGSSQRLRTNFIPIGIVYPLILEKIIRDKKLSSKSHS